MISATTRRGRKDVPHDLYSVRFQQQELRHHCAVAHAFRARPEHASSVCTDNCRAFTGDHRGFLCSDDMDSSAETKTRRAEQNNGRRVEIRNHPPAQIVEIRLGVGPGSMLYKGRRGEPRSAPNHTQRRAKQETCLVLIAGRRLWRRLAPLRLGSD